VESTVRCRNAIKLKRLSWKIKKYVNNLNT
jgi:hypothetical protein